MSARLNQVVPAEPNDGLKPAPRLSSSRACKLPCCAYYIAMRRVNYFMTVAVVAAFCTFAIAGVKFWLALRGEEEQAIRALKNTGVTLAKAFKLQMESDFGTLDAVANLWYVKPKLTRSEFRKFIMSDYFVKDMTMVNTVILAHRIQNHERNAAETDPGSVQLRIDCCNRTTYDRPILGKRCRETAINQCRIPGDRYHFMQARKVNGRGGVYSADWNSSEYLIIMYQEPLELNAGPTGFDFFSKADRKAGFDEAERTGMKAVTKRLKRVFAQYTEYGMLVFNNVFTRRDYKGVRTLIGGNITVQRKQRVIDAGHTPYAIGSIVAVYKVQDMLRTMVESVFPIKEVKDTKIYLFDDRTTTPATEQLIAYYDPMLTQTQGARFLADIADTTKAQVLGRSPRSVVNSRGVDDTSFQFSIVLEPNDAYFSSKTGPYPYYILMVSIAVILIAQLERWLGHPYIISETEYVRALIEAKIRADLEEEIAKSTALAADKVQLSARYGVKDDDEELLSVASDNVKPPA